MEEGEVAILQSYHFHYKFLVKHVISEIPSVSTSSAITCCKEYLIQLSFNYLHRMLHKKMSLNFEFTLIFPANPCYL